MMALAFYYGYAWCKIDGVSYQQVIHNAKGYWKRQTHWLLPTLSGVRNNQIP